MALSDTFLYASSVDYTAVTAWTTGATQHAGDLIRQSAAPAVNSERCFVCIASTGGTGTTGGSEPTWVVTRGAKNTDNTVTWQEATGIAALNGDLTNTLTWTQFRTLTSTATLGQVIKSGDGTKVLICTTTGTMANLGSEPTWATYLNAGATTNDGVGAVWTTIKVISGGIGYAAWSAPAARAAIMTATNWGQAGTTYNFRNTHAETQSTALTIGCATGATSGFSKFLSIGATVPATTVTAGASISTTGASTITDGTSGTCLAYFYGITLSAGSGSSVANISFGASAGNEYVFDTCIFTLNNTGASAFLFSQSALQLLNNYKFYNCTWNFGSNTSQNISSDNGSSVRFHRWEIIGGSATFGASLPTTLFGTGAGNIAPSNLIVRGFDLSLYTSGTLVSGHPDNSGVAFFDCAIASGVTRQGTYSTVATVAETNIVRCDNTGTDYRHEKYNERAGQTIETTIVRTGGGSDGVTPIAWNITTLSRIQAWTRPFSCFPLLTWNASTSQVTATVYGIWKTAARPLTTDIDIEIEYLGASNSTLGTVINTSEANILAAGQSLTADTSAWGAGAAAYQTAHAYGAFTGVILAGNASPQQLWFMSSHSGTGTSGSSTTIFNGKNDGDQVTDNSGANQIIWQALTRWSIEKQFTPGQQGAIYTRVRVFKATTTFYVDPLVVIA